MVRELIDTGRAAELAGELDAALAAYERAFGLCAGHGGPSDVALVLRWIGNVRRARGDVELAVELYEASLAIAEANGLAREEVAALNCLAIAEQARGGVERAASLYARAAALAAASDETALVAMVQQNMGALANVQGRFAEALACYRTAVALARGVGDDVTVSHALNNIGMTHVDLAEWQDAERCFDEALVLAEGRDDLPLVGTIALNRAELLLKRERLDDVRAACDRALGVFNALRSKPSVGEAYKLIAMLHRTSGRPYLADAYFACALGLAETSDDLLLQAEVQLEWASLHLERGRWQQGITYLNRSLHAFRQLDARREVLDIQRRIERAESIYVAGLRAWVEKLEVAAGIPAGHAARVAAAACALARTLGVGGWELVTVHVAALIHDIGSAALRGGPHDAGDAAYDRAERIAGDALARELDFPAEVRRIVRACGERWAGAGQPDGLAAHEIPPGARLIAIADAYDRLTEPRPGEDRLDADAALDALRAEAGVRFEPRALETFAALISGLHAAAA